RQSRGSLARTLPRDAESLEHAREPVAAGAQQRDRTGEVRRGIVIRADGERALAGGDEHLDGAPCIDLAACTAIVARESIDRFAAGFERVDIRLVQPPARRRPELG